jgi:hypothetical protein
MTQPPAGSLNRLARGARRVHHFPPPEAARHGGLTCSRSWAPFPAGVRPDRAADRRDGQIRDALREYDET